MKLSNPTAAAVKEAILKAVSSFSKDSEPVFTDIHFQAVQESGQLTILDDDDNNLSEVVLEEWAGYQGQDFYEMASRILQSLLSGLQKEGALEDANIIKPYNYVLVDEDKESIKELLVMDDETIIVSGGLLEGLDEDLNNFLKDLLKDEF